MLAGWLRQVEQVRAGVLAPADLDAARRSAGKLDDHLDDYERSLVAAEVSAVYRKNTLAAVRRVANDCGFSTLADVARAAAAEWLARQLAAGMSARSRNHYRQALVTFANWCKEDGRIRDHDLDRLPKADERADPRRRRRALTEAELGKLLAVTAARPSTTPGPSDRAAGRAKPTPTSNPTPLHA